MDRNGDYAHRTVCEDDQWQARNIGDVDGWQPASRKRADPSHPRGRRKTGEQERGLRGDCPQHVVMRMMRELVRKDDFDLVLRVISDERVRQEDTACPT